MKNFSGKRPIIWVFEKKILPEFSKIQEADIYSYEEDNHYRESGKATGQKHHQ